MLFDVCDWRKLFPSDGMIYHGFNTFCGKLAHARNFPPTEPMLIGSTRLHGCVRAPKPSGVDIMDG